jgi:hypothetical protein
VDFFYFTGTMQRGSLFVPADGDPVLFIERTMERALFETPLRITPIRKDKDVKDILAAKGLLKGRGALSSMCSRLPCTSAGRVFSGSIVLPTSHRWSRM